MRKKSYLYIVVSISVLNSCLKDKVPNEFAACSDLVSFSQDIQPLVELNCLGCHNEVVAANDVILTNHLRIANEANRMINSMQASGMDLMPFGGPPLSDSLIQLFQCWILQGKLDN
tara:strand:- start:61 stop:408 length:348 start_codon:yes stop_codon:yes gene_type:complete